MDHLHSAAFEGSGLGLSILGSEENIQTINKSMIDNFVATHYTGVPCYTSVDDALVSV